LAVCLDVLVRFVPAAAEETAAATAAVAGFEVGDEEIAVARDLFIGTMEGGTGTVAEVAATTGRVTIVGSSLMRVEPEVTLQSGAART